MKKWLQPYRLFRFRSGKITMSGAGFGEAHVAYRFPVATTKRGGGHVPVDPGWHFTVGWLAAQCSGRRAEGLRRRFSARQGQTPVRGLIGHSSHALIDVSEGKPGGFPSWCLSFARRDRPRSSAAVHV